MYHATFPDRRMPAHRIFQRLHRELRETHSSHVTPLDASRRRAVRSPSRKESILNIVADRRESDVRAVAHHTENFRIRSYGTQSKGSLTRVYTSVVRHSTADRDVSGSNQGVPFFRQSVFASVTVCVTSVTGLRHIRDGVCTHRKNLPSSYFSNTPKEV
ncbi:hypothetical protein TNCV_1051681 [Trichonephila clavipes]|nr:hypothetical protein TNCV_1051681 [Trichonephila clavipes]